MPSLVELKYNPYIPNLNILIDGKQPPDFSRLVQYTDEDICLWYWEIMEAIYSEIRNDFYISFTGTAQDAQILENLCKQYKFCKGFRSNSFVVSELLQARMKRLNQFIKRRGIVVYTKTVIDAVFLLPPQMQKYLEDIVSLDVNNLFCSVRVTTIGLKSTYEETENRYLFLVTDNELTGVERLNNLKLQRPAFVLVLDKKVGYMKITENAWFYGTSDEQLFNTIFLCLLQRPLLNAFRKCINSLQEKEINAELLQLYAVDPVIHIDLSAKIEVGKSSRITVISDPPNMTLPKLIYRIVNQNVASCDGLCVFGKQEGITTLEVYKEGDKKPFFTKEIKVFKRNRITKIILSDDTIIFGKGDRRKIACDYIPQNADNARSIIWKSSDENIVTVDENGSIYAKGLGNCRIICVAENVSAQCMCTVKPYLEKIELEIETDDDIVHLEPMQEFELRVKTYPEKCVDDLLTITSSDCDIVNVVNSTLYAKEKGEVVITVKNVNGRISQTFKVNVAKKKIGFFKTIFKK